VIRELKFDPRFYGWNREDDLLAYSLTLGRKLLRNVRPKTLLKRDGLTYSNQALN
jgi:hypothetical protein